eukprot:1015870-Pyramimonas_sp.AAC.1
MDGALPDDEEDDLMNIMRGRLTLNADAKTSLTKSQEDDAKGECELDEDDCATLDEDLRHLSNDTLEKGVKP